MKNKQNYLILAIVVTVALIPVAYSVTEPNIIIDMITDQTTNPFTILNSTGYEMLSISPEGAINEKLHIFYTSDYATVISVEATDTDTNPLLLALWEIDRGPITEPQKVNIQEATLNALVKVNSGPSCIEVAWGYTIGDDLTDWILFSDDSGSEAFFDEIIWIGGGPSRDNSKYIGAMLSSCDGVTTGEVKSLVMTADVTLPPDMKLVRVI